MDIPKSWMARRLLLLVLLGGAVTSADLLMGLDFRLCPSSSSSSADLLHWSSLTGGSLGGVSLDLSSLPPVLRVLNSPVLLPAANWSEWSRLTVGLSKDLLSVDLQPARSPRVSMRLQLSRITANRLLLSSATPAPGVCIRRAEGKVQAPTHACVCPDADADVPLSMETAEHPQQLLTRLRRSTSDACSPSPCQHSKPCTVSSSAPGGYVCNCNNSLGPIKIPGGERTIVFGYEGVNCSTKMDVCKSSPCLNSAFCDDEKGRFQCLCRRDDAGYTYSGVLCQTKLDQCNLPHTTYNISQNDPVCIHGNCSTVGDYPFFNCACNRGYEGVRCDVDIDECKPKPCKNKATCDNLIGEYKCNCLPGYNGTNCEIDIDECAPKPCVHGQCIDQVNNYTCNCTDTGFKGRNCEINIDDCEPKPCKNNATCVDGVKEFNCSCHPGYTGPTCAVDINECSPSPCRFESPCLQRSDQSLYGKAEYKHLPPFNGSFSYSDAAGYVCQCVPGSEGVNCSIDIDECVPKPCKNKARCENQLNAFRCHCVKGYEGKTCAVEIDECTRYRACQNGATCKDEIGDYTCQCLTTPNSAGAVFGGKNCSVELVACRNHKCQAGGACVPYVELETKHNYTCRCLPGRAGERCEIDTTRSFSGASNLTVNAAGFSDLSFDFRTTLSDATLLSVQNSNFSVQLVGGRVALGSDPPVGPSLGLSAAPWLRLAIVDSQRLEVGAGAVNVSLTKFLKSGTGIGVVEVGKGFKGCIRDVKGFSNDTLLVPESGGRSLVTEEGVAAGCTRRAQCQPDPCGVGSRATACLDLWTEYRCICALGRIGKTCEGNTTAMTFGYNNATSFIKYSVTDAMRKYITDGRGFQLQLLIQAWPPTTSDKDSMLAYVGVTASQPLLQYLLLLLTSQGYPKIILKTEIKDSSDSTGSDITRSFTNLKVATGLSQAITVSVTEGASVKLTVSAPGIGQSEGALDAKFAPSSFLAAASIIFIGGYPGAKAAPYSFGNPPKRAKRSTAALPTEVKNMGYLGLRGVVSDARTVGPVRLNLEKGGATTGTSVVPSEVAAEKGRKTEDVCAISKPCKYNGTCTNVFFNTFRCDCPTGKRGVTCAFPDYCVLSSRCPTGYTCQNFEEQSFYECKGSISLATTSPAISFTPTGETGGVDVGYVAMRIRTRVASALTLLSLVNSANSVIGKVELLESGLLKASRTAPSSVSAESTFKANTGSWVSFGVDLRNEAISITSTVASGVISTVTKGLEKITKSVLMPDQKFKGCVSSVTVNGYPFALHTQVNAEEGGPPKWRPTLTTSITNLIDSNKGVCKSDSVCNPNPCANGGTCLNLWNAFQCNCTDGFNGTNCSQPVCSSAPGSHLHSACLNGGKCVAGANPFKCSCATGYIGYRCAGSNPCSSSPCKNGATCLPIVKVDGDSSTKSVVEKKCNCTSGWSGATCTEAVNTASVNYGLIFGIVGAILLVLIIVLIVLIVRHVRGVRSSRGVYDPHAQEINGSHAYMSNVIKPPPSERLI